MQPWCGNRNLNMRTSWLKEVTKTNRLLNLERSIDTRISKLGYETLGIWLPSLSKDKIRILVSTKYNLNTVAKFYVDVSEIDEELIERIYFSLLFN